MMVVSSKMVSSDQDKFLEGLPCASRQIYCISAKNRSRGCCFALINNDIMLSCVRAPGLLFVFLTN